MRCLASSLIVVGAWMLTPSAAAAQSRNLLTEMQGYAAALGVECEHCHTAPRGSSEPQPKKDIARQMIGLTRDINMRVQLATGKPPSDATRVECVTCHRGVPIPKRLGQLITDTLFREGVEAAESQYRDLHKRFYGRGGYDFGEEELVGIARSLASARPDDAIRLLELNIEFNPASAKSYALLGFAYTRKFDDESALAAVEKAVELEPENGEYQGQLAQLKMVQRKR
jgi:tetratricopeptide (TPR) repeat protein